MSAEASGASPQAFHAMAVVAAFRAALAAAGSVDARRAGRDPSDQQPAVDARAGLALAAEGVAESVVRLRLRASAGSRVHAQAAVIQAFENRLVLGDLAQAARLAHQSLLSLYPDVPEALVETARRIAVDAQGFSAHDGPLDAILEPLAESAAGWLDGLRDALGPRFV